MTALGRFARSRYGHLPEPVLALIDLAEVLTDVTAGLAGMTAGVGHLTESIGATGRVDPVRLAAVLAAIAEATRALHQARDTTCQLLEEAARNTRQARP